jgi:hypothetical protein
MFMGIESSHLNLSFENESRKRAVVEEARRRWEEKVKADEEKGILTKDFGPVDERIAILKEKYEELLDNNGFSPDSPAIQEFVKMSERSLPDQEAIKKFEEEIRLLEESKFGRSDKKETTH